MKRRIIEIVQDKCNGGGLEHAAVTALKNSGKMVPWQVYTISTDGKILD